jgi:DNA-binding transcriptional MerR regulator
MEYQLPDKLTFKRKEVINLTRLDGRVLDYWEREFTGLKPVVNNIGEKFYSRKDLELILTIKQFLVVQKKDKAEVKTILGQEPAAAGQNAAPAVADNGTLKAIKRELQDILTILSKRDTK